MPWVPRPYAYAGGAAPHPTRPSGRTGRGGLRGAMVCLVLGDQTSRELFFLCPRRDLAVQSPVTEAAEGFADSWAARDAEGEEVVAVEVGAFVAGVRGGVEAAGAGWWLFVEGGAGPKGAGRAGGGGAGG